MDMNVKSILNQDLFQLGAYAAFLGEERMSVGSNEKRKCYTPIDDTYVGEINFANEEAYNKLVDASFVAYNQWKMMPAPKRGEIVRNK
jgi:aldehyde dehydrogenase (NAD+)